LITGHVEAEELPVFGLSPEPPVLLEALGGTLLALNDMEMMLMKGSDSFKVVCSAE
jgi:hypothetical protein